MHPHIIVSGYKQGAVSQGNVPQKTQPEEIKEPERI